FGAALDGVQRVETTGDKVDLKSPSIIERLDLSPRLTFPLKSFAGFTLTPSVGVRSTFYSNSLDPVQRQFVGQSLLRNYADLDLDWRAPGLAKVFSHGDGTPWFKHVIEPFVEYRRIKGIDDFDRTPLIDERDLVADTNEVEYGVTNRFFVKRQTYDGSEKQTHELLSLTVSQKYFFDPTFGGALRPGPRNQFFPVNTLFGFAFAGVERDASPVHPHAPPHPPPPPSGSITIRVPTASSISSSACGMERESFLSARPGTTPDASRTTNYVRINFYSIRRLFRATSSTSPPPSVIGRTDLTALLASAT